MKIYLIIAILSLVSQSGAQQYGALKSSRLSSLYVVFDGNEFKEVELGVEIKKDTEGKDKRLIKRMWIKVDGVKANVSEKALSSGVEIALDTVVVGKDSPDDKSYDYFIRIKNNVGNKNDFETICFKFKNGVFVKSETLKYSIGGKD